MKLELLAPLGLSLGLAFALTGANGNTPKLTKAQQELLVVHAACQQLNDKFLGRQDSYASARVKGCVMAVRAAEAILK